MRHCTSATRLKNANHARSAPYLGLSNAETLEQLGMLDGQLNHLLDLLDLLVETADHVIGGVGYLFDAHQADERVDLRSEKKEERNSGSWNCQ